MGSATLITALKKMSNCENEAITFTSYEKKNKKKLSVYKTYSSILRHPFIYIQSLNSEIKKRLLLNCVLAKKKKVVSARYMNRVKGKCPLSRYLNEGKR